MLTLLEGAIAESMPLWNPTQFIKTAADGSWWRGTTVANKWVDHAGVTTPVVADQELIGNWLDELGNRALKNTTGNDSRPVWDSATASVKFATWGSGQRLLTHTLSSPIPVNQYVSIMATVAAVGGGLDDGDGGLTRGAIGATNSYGNNGNSVCLRPRHGEDPGAVGDAMATLNSSGFDGLDGLTTPNTSDSFSSFSFQRSPDHSNKIIQFYKNGALVSAGPSFSPADGADLLQLFAIGPAIVGRTLYIKDLIIAFKKTRPSDHIGYHQYALTLP